MSEVETPASGAGEGESASGDQPINGNPAGGDDNQPGEGEGGEAANAGADDDDWSDPRSAKNRFTKVTAEKTALEQIAEDAKKAAAEADKLAAYWKGQAEARAAAAGGGEQPKPAPKADPNPEPDPKNKDKYPLGTDDPNYMIDRAKYEIKAEQAAEAAKAARDAAAKADFEERKGNFLRARDAAGKNEDTPNAVKVLDNMPPALVDLVAVSSNPSLIAEHLHNNPEDYKALVKHVGEDGRLTPKGLAEVSRKLGSYDATLPGAFASKKVSKAGNPAETVQGGGGGKGGNDPYKRTMSTEEYRAWRASGGGE